MAKKTYVTITADGLQGTPVGASITYQVGSIPVASVQLAPGGANESKVNGGTGNFGNIDKKKRQDDITLSIKVKSDNGEAGVKTKTLKFIGLLDGLSVTNMVGQNSYSAVLKNKAQKLLELTTLTPGLYPTSVNIYRSSSFSIVTDAQKPEDKAVAAWGHLKFGLTSSIHQKNPIDFWLDLLKHIVEKQTSGWKEFLGTSKMVTNKVPFDDIFNDKRYKKSLEEAKNLLSSIDTSAINTGAIAKAKSSNPQISAALKDIFAASPTVFLENLMTFLSEFGCSLIFSNTKIFIVPINSVIQQPNVVPGLKKLHTEPNTANPADYNSYSYNDNGYRDLGSVIVTLNKYVAGAWLAGRDFERGQIAHYIAPEEISQGSGVFVVETTPWMTYAHDSPQGRDAKDTTIDNDKPGKSMHPDKVPYKDVVDKTTSEHEGKAQEKKETYSKELENLLLNYGETIFFQQRYGDRHGTITMDFNPDWVPGTGGSLYIRESNMFINFYVTSVTHQVDTSPPSNGQAITIVNFCCGRMGPNPPGTKDYKFLGYDRDKEVKVQKDFIADIT